MGDFIRCHWGDVASVAGLVASIIGFILTIRVARHAEDAAQQANTAATAAKRSIMAANALVDFASAMAIMEEIRRLQREGAWRILPDRYAALKQALMALRSEHPSLTDAQQTAIQASLMQVREIEQKVERALEQKADPSGVAKMNGVISGEIEKISEVLVSLKREIKA